MLTRPSALGIDFGLTSTDDVDAALHEMSWITARGESLDNDARVRIEAIKKETDAKHIVEIDGQTITLRDRWNQLFNAVYAWCTPGLKKALPANKKTLALSHGEIKLRQLPAAVAILEGGNADRIAFDAVTKAGIVSAVDRLMKKTIDVPNADQIQLSQIVSVKFELNKNAIKDLWSKRPETRQVLRDLLISVEDGQEQITISPAQLLVTNPA